MPRLVHRAHELVRQVVKPGDWCIDATLGNGYDTAELCKLVGPSGHVWGCDIQPAAICETARRLAELPYDNTTLIACDHARLVDFLSVEIHGKVAAVMMNLGFLPGGELPIFTVAESTVAAIEKLYPLLRPGGLLSVIAYTGHDLGLAETTAVCECFAHFTSCGVRTIHETPASFGGPAPQLFAAWKS